MQYAFRIAAATVALLAASSPAQAAAAATPICANCHEQAHSSTALGAHGAKNDAMGSMCQACHGDASAHLEDPMKNKMANKLAKATSAAAKDAVCMTCHDGNRSTIPAANRADSYLNGFYANPEYKANIIYGLVTYRF